jgi:hypothetical protein
MADGIAAAVLSIGPGNAKTALSVGIALGALLGVPAAHVDREGRYNAHGRMAASAVCRVRHAAVLSGCFPPFASTWSLSA